MKLCKRTLCVHSRGVEIPGVYCHFRYTGEVPNTGTFACTGCGETHNPDDKWEVHIVDLNSGGHEPTSYAFYLPKETDEGIVQLVGYGVLFKNHWSLSDTRVWITQG